MNVLDLLIKFGIEPVKASSSKGGEWWSPCPGCGGDDRFHVWPAQNNGGGSYWCRRCDKGGDAIQFLMDFENKTFPEACTALGREIPSSESFRRPFQRPKTAKTAWKPTEYKAPTELWRKKAGAFIDKCHSDLLIKPEKLAWLAGRGLDIEAVKAFKLGVNLDNYFRSRESWGLETILKADKKPKKLWIPRGIVIPYLVNGIGSNIPLRIRIRRPKADLKTEKGRKYYIVPGSGMDTMLIRLHANLFVILEAELDAMATAAACPDDIGALAVGSSSTKPDMAAAAILKHADRILVALDFDEAGAKAWQWWQQQYPQAERWPVPDGKDPGDAIKAGVDLYAWVYAGLPPSMTVGRSFLDCGKKGGADILPETVAEKAAAAPEKELGAELEKKHKCKVCGWYGEHYEFCPAKG